jgi:hypothetical protein
MRPAYECVGYFVDFTASTYESPGHWFVKLIRCNRTGRIHVGLLEHGDYASRGIAELAAMRWWREDSSCDFSAELGPRMDGMEAVA